MDNNWYKGALYKIHLDLHTPEWHESILSNFDPKKIVETVCKTGAKALYFFAKDCYGNAYYNTCVGHKHKCMGNRDFLYEVIKEATKEHLPIVAYFSVIWDNYCADKHPEWQMRGPDGEAIRDVAASSGTRWKYLCHNSPYSSYIQAMVEEVAKGYDVSGFHLDMFNFDFGGLSCYCDNCKKLFREQTGKELPTQISTDEIWRQFLEFRYRSVERLAQNLRDTIQNIRPGLPVIMNYHGSPGFDWRTGQMPVRHSLYSSMGTGETYTPFFGDLYPGLESRFVRDLVPGKPFELVSWRMNRMTDFTIKPLNQLRWELFTSLASGASVMLIDQPFHDGRLDEVAYERLREVFSEIEAKKPFWGGEPVRHIAIYYSCKNRDLYGLDDLSRFLMPVIGAYKALVESQFNVGFLFDETITLEAIKDFQVVLLPDVAVMSQKEVDIFREYVKQGGVLISSFNTSLYSENGQKLEDFQLSEAFGVSYCETIDCINNYLRNLGPIYGRGIDPRQYILNMGKVHKVTVTTAKGFGDVHEAFFKCSVPERFFSHNMHPPYNRISDALYINKYGNGTAIYIPHQLDASYANLYEIPEHRKVLKNIILAHSEPPVVSIEAPLNVEVFVNKKSDKIFVHLLSFNSLRQAVTLRSLNDAIRPSSRMEQPAIYRAIIDVKVPFKNIEVFEPDTQVEVNGQRVSIFCEAVHEVICIKTR